METGIYITGLLSGFGLAFIVAFTFALFHASYVVFVRLIEP
jgi:ABC-type transport system involved in multi-copper enzyme maturation permease subunit